MVDLKNIKDRFENLLRVKTHLGMETIQAIYTEDDLKSIIYYLGELSALKESEEQE